MNRAATLLVACQYASILVAQRIIPRTYSCPTSRTCSPRLLKALLRIKSQTRWSRDVLVPTNLLLIHLVQLTRYDTTTDELYNGKTASRIQNRYLPYQFCPPIEIQFVRDICSVRLGRIGHRVVERVEK